MTGVYQEILEALKAHLGPRAEAVVREGALALGRSPEALSGEDWARVLKGVVFRELQARLRPEEARKVVEGLLARTAPRPPEVLGVRAQVEEALKRFQIYLDWPEVARLRAFVNRIRQEGDNPDPNLLGEALVLVEGLEEKLEEALLRQAKDLAYLEETLNRVRHLGGPKVRRLERDIQSIREAHQEGTLAQGEVERARALALELRKLLESSAVRTPNLTLPEITFATLEETPRPDEDLVLTVEEAPEDLELVVDLGALPEAEAQRIQALEVEEERRRLEDLLRRYAPVLERATVSPLLAEVQALLEAGTPVGEKLKTLEEALKEAEANLRAERRARLIQLQEAVHRLPLPEEAKAQAQNQLALAEETLKEGGFPDLAPLEEEVRRLEAEARRLEEERARLKAEKEALLKELEAGGEAFQALYEELRHLPLEALPQALPALRARQAEILRRQGEMEALKAKLQEAQRALRALEPEALALGLDEALRAAEAQLEEGQLPDLEALRAEIQRTRALRRAQALSELARLEEAARRLAPLGGESLLRLIEAEKGKPLPDPAPIARALQALRRKLQSKREEIKTRLLGFSQEYQRLRPLSGETAARLRPLAEFLEAALDRLDRLGPQGLLEVEAALGQADALLKTLKQEAEAAQAVLKDLGKVDVEALFGQILTPSAPKGPAPAPALEALRLPGVEVLEVLGASSSLPQAALEAFRRAVDRLDQDLGRPHLAASLLFGGRALVLAPYGGETLVALMDRSALLAFLLELRKGGPGEG